MPRKELPEWKLKNGSSLNVFRDLGLDCDYSKLVIFKNKAHKTGGYKWRYLPSKNKDIRQFKEGKKRLYYVGSTGESDPFVAGKIAIKQLEEVLESIKKDQKQIRYNSSHSLHHYWEIWYSKFSRNPSNSDRNKRDRLNQWNAKEWGIASQKWSRKSIDEITPSDIHEYFLFLDSRGDGTQGSMAQQKENQRTILNKLHKEAKLSDFPSLRPFSFPKITRKKTQVEHFFSDEWDLLINQIIELSEGNTKEISKEYYQSLPNNLRQWVDLYDALMLMWFFYLRSEDVPRLQTEWFTDRSNWVYVKLEKTKQDRLSQETQHFRPDGYDNFKKIQIRKPTGYLSFPSIPRKSGAENDSNVGETANRLLKEVVKIANIRKKNPVTLTTIRHTSMRLTLEEYTDFQLENNLRVFADNANTSIEMLRKTYLKYSNRGKIASKARNSIKPREWSLTKRVQF